MSDEINWAQFPTIGQARAKAEWAFADNARLRAELAECTCVQCVDRIKELDADNARLRQQLDGKAEVRRSVEINLSELARLRRVNAELVEAAREYLDYCEPNLEGEPILMRIRESMRAALRSATETPSTSARLRAELDAAADFEAVRSAELARLRRVNAGLVKALEDIARLESEDLYHGDIDTARVIANAAISIAKTVLRSATETPSTSAQEGEPT